MLVNLNIDRMRRRRYVEVAADQAPEPHDAGRGQTTPDQRDEVLRLLRGLTERERRVVVLRHYFDLPEAQVAAELGIAVGTVKSTLHRALTKLRVAATSIPHVETTGRTR